MVQHLWRRISNALTPMPEELLRFRRLNPHVLSATESTEHFLLDCPLVVQVRAESDWIPHCPVGGSITDKAADWIQLDHQVGARFSPLPGVYGKQGAKKFSQQSPQMHLPLSTELMPCCTFFRRRD